MLPYFLSTYTKSIQTYPNMWDLLHWCQSFTQASFSSTNPMCPCAKDGKAYSSSYLAFMFSLSIEHYLLTLHLADFPFKISWMSPSLPVKRNHSFLFSSILFVPLLVSSLCCIAMCLFACPFFPIRFQEPWLIHSVSRVHTIVPNAAGSVQM